MEDGLRVWEHVIKLDGLYGVLILVLMEDGLRELVNKLNELSESSLNPCFNGRWSARIYYS